MWRLGAGALLHRPCVKHQEKGAATRAVEDHGQEHPIILIPCTRRGDEDRLSRVAARHVPVLGGAGCQVYLCQPVEPRAGIPILEAHTVDETVVAGMMTLVVDAWQLE